MITGLEKKKKKMMMIGGEGNSHFKPDRFLVNMPNFSVCFFMYVNYLETAKHYAL